MPQSRRLSRRLVGVICKRFAELELGRVQDPRARRGRLWRLPVLLRLLLVGVMTGRKGLAEVEYLSKDLATPLRRLLGVGRRVADTTLRDLLCRIDPEQLRRVLHRKVRCAHRRKALALDGLPFGVVSMDGRSTATNLWDDGNHIAQRHKGKPALVRTITSCLISTRARPCIDMHVVTPTRNEMSAFPAAFARLVQELGALFRVVMYDSSASSAANARLIVEAGKVYVFCLKAEQPKILAEAQRLLGRKRPSTAVQTTTLAGSNVVVRRMWIDERIAGWHGFPGLRAAIRLQTETTDKVTGVVTKHDRYYITSLPASALTAREWHMLIRRRWSVENECHCTWDRIFREDDWPWIRQPEGMVNVMLLRRIAYNALALFRSVTQRSAKARAVPWKRLMEQLRNALLVSTVETIAGLHLPPEALATR